MEWTLAISRHGSKRMALRGLGEVELRLMLDSVRLLRSDVVEGRWVAAMKHQGRRWEIVLEPDGERRLLIVVTAYALDP